MFFTRRFQITSSIVAGCVAIAFMWSIRSSLVNRNTEPTSHTALNVRLGWLVNANSAGQIAALEQGFYYEAGLDVSLHEGGLAMPSVKSVASGSDQIGFANGPELVIAARAAGVPLRIVAVVHEQGYHAFFIRDESSITSPRDWEGKRIGIKIGSPTYIHYQALLSKFSVDRSKVKEVPLGTNLLPFLNRDIDVYPGAKTNEGISLIRKGVNVRLLETELNGVPTMGNVIFTTDQYLADHPEIVKKFVDATMRGWEWCRIERNRKLAISHLAKHNTKLDEGKELVALGETLQLIGSGRVPVEKLRKILDLQAEHTSLPRKPDLAELIYEEKLGQ